MSRQRRVGPSSNRWAYESHTHAGGGLVASQSTPAGGYTAQTNFPTVTFNSAAGHLYRISWSLSVKNTGAADTHAQAWFLAWDDAGVDNYAEVRVIDVAALAPSATRAEVGSVLISPGATVVGLAATISPGAYEVSVTETLGDEDFYPSFLVVEDLGVAPS